MKSAARAQIFVRRRPVIGDLLGKGLPPSDIGRRPGGDRREGRLEKALVIHERKLEFEDFCGLIAGGDGQGRDLAVCRGEGGAQRPFFVVRGSAAAGQTDARWRQGSMRVAVARGVVDAFEDGHEVLRAYTTAVRAALESVGIAFPFEIADGRARPAGVTYSPPDRKDAH
jgi:hypothetical protein